MLSSLRELPYEQRLQKSKVTNTEAELQNQQDRKHDKNGMPVYVVKTLNKSMRIQLRYKKDRMSNRKQEQ